MGTETALGRGLHTVTLFPAGAENFASIGAARERETSTPGYRPGLRRRGGQQGGACPQHFPTMSPLCTAFTAHNSSAAHRPSPRTHCPTCAVHSTIPSLCHSHIPPSRTAIPYPWSCWPHHCSIHTSLCALQSISAWGQTSQSVPQLGTPGGARTHGHASMCTQPPPGTYKSILCPTSASAVQYSTWG